MALGTPDRTAGGGRVYIGTVTRVTGTTCFVEVPRYAKGFELGPCRYPAELAPTAGDPNNTGNAGTHGHTITIDQAGDHSHTYTDTNGASSASGPTSSAGGHSHTGSAAEAGDHSHTVPRATPPLAPGDSVVVAFLEGGDDDAVVLVRLA